MKNQIKAEIVHLFVLILIKKIQISGVERGILGQILGGLIFSAFAGQPMVILGTTTAMSIYISSISYRFKENSEIFSCVRDYE